eukprot:11215112-Ditylum_brightwellii.AAC.1
MGWTCSEQGHVMEKEELSQNMPKPRGFGFNISARVDTDHTEDSVSRRSRTGFFVYCNLSPVFWVLKKQTSIESSLFGYEFIAMKQCCECISHLSAPPMCPHKQY